MAKNHNEKLPVWLERFQRAESAWAAERDRMSFREERLDGAKTIMGPDGKKAQEQATHVRNVCFEMVETQVDSNIPQPKVTALREEDERLAKIAEDLLRFEDMHGRRESFVREKSIDWALHNRKHYPDAVRETENFQAQFARLEAKKAELEEYWRDRP